MCSNVKDLVVNHKGVVHEFSLRTTEDHGGFMWIVYDHTGAHLYSENYDPDEINPADEASMYCQGYCEENY